MAAALPHRAGAFNPGFHRPAAHGTLPGMDRAAINAFCATFPGAEVSDPWGGGHDAWKVGGKMFASLGAMSDGVSVKTDSIETAEMLIAAGIGRRAPYLHRSWVHLDPGTDPEELRHRIARSYALIRAGLPRRVQAALGEGPLDPV